MKIAETNPSFRAELFEFFFKEAIRPMLRQWRTSVMTSPDMPEGERAGKIYAYCAMQEGLLDFCAKTKVNIPEWLTEEFE